MQTTHTLPAFKRWRKLRASPAIRSMLEETHLLKQAIIAPLFVTEGPTEPIEALPKVQRYALDDLLTECERLLRKGFDKVALFPHISPHKRNDIATESHNENGLIQNALRALKHHFPQLCLFADVALDPYTSHGHDGIVRSDGSIDNDATLELLVLQALSHAAAGADFIAPSDMMDGRVARIRAALDEGGFDQTAILSYSAKYASALYGPFRNAIGTSLAFGDKKTYQMNPANVREALLESITDQEEGADMLMIKPALSYLDVIVKLKERTLLPVGAYHVSGEYAMVMAAHNQGYLDGPSVLKEHLLSIKRAGADFIYTYGYNAL